VCTLQQPARRPVEVRPRTPTEQVGNVTIERALVIVILVLLILFLLGYVR
jgi:hypothetical protein